MNQWRASNDGDNNHNIHDTIYEIDHLVFTNEVTLENHDFINEEVQNLDSPMMTSKIHQDATSSKCEKWKLRTMDSDLELVTKSIEKIVDVFEKCTTQMVKCHQKRPISEDTIWKQLQELGVE